MNSSSDRISMIKARLQQAFTPSYLEVKDESEQHRGHAHYQGGGKHFAITITAEKLNQLSRVDGHRAVYALFADMLPHQIHALRIQVVR